MEGGSNSWRSPALQPWLKTLHTGVGVLYWIRGRLKLFDYCVLCSARLFCRKWACDDDGDDRSFPPALRVKRVGDL